MPGVDEIRLEMLKGLAMVRLSWLSHLFNIAWRSGTMPVEWQTRVVVPIFKKGDRRVCSNYRVSHYREQCGFRPGLAELLRGHGSLIIQFIQFLIVLNFWH